MGYNGYTFAWVNVDIEAAAAEMEFFLYRYERMWQASLVEEIKTTVKKALAVEALDFLNTVKLASMFRVVRERYGGKLPPMGKGENFFILDFIHRYRDLIGHETTKCVNIWGE